MASYTAAIATHQTLSASGVADTVTLSSDFDYVEVMMRDEAPTKSLYFCVDGDGGPAGDGVPTIRGADTFVVAAACGASLKVPSRRHQGSVVKIISEAAQKYSVTGVSE